MALWKIFVHCMLLLISQFLSPASTVSVRNAWDNDPSFWRAHKKKKGKKKKKRNACIFRVVLLKQARLTRFTRSGARFYLRFAKYLDLKLHFATKILRENLVHKLAQFRSLTWKCFNVKISSSFPGVRTKTSGLMATNFRVIIRNSRIL